MIPDEMPQAFVAKVDWDEEAGVWVLVETNFPGLVAEAPTMEDLIIRIRTVAEELLPLNRHLFKPSLQEELPICITAERQETIRAIH